MADKASIKVMVVDDDPFILKMHARILHMLGYTAVTTCEGAVRATETLEREAHPDVILLDLNMPEMDGVQFMRGLVDRTYRGSLILLSGEDERVLQAAERLARAHQLTLLGHMQKPVKQEGLGNLLQKWAPASQGAARAARKIYSPTEVAVAISRGELMCHYQPKVSLETGHVLGMEALVRWNHPLDGLVYPDQFIGVAEENGLIHDLTRVVISTGLAQLGTWKDDLKLDLHLAMNVSMDDLSSLDFADFIATQASVADVAPQRVTLEVTETRLMQDQRAPLDVLTRLRLKRFRLSIDDFGTGHSSMAQLRDIPFDELKIDRGFVHGAWNDETVRAIFDTSVTLARQLDMRIVVEGIEDRADWDFVCYSGCHIGQGYFIAKPMPPEKVPDWIDDWEERAEELLPNRE